MRWLLISPAPSTANEIMEAIQSPKSTNLPTVPKVLECPLKNRIPRENRNSTGIRINRNNEIPQIIFGISPKSKRWNGHCTIPKTNKMTLAANIETIIEVDIIKNSKPRSLSMTLGIALRRPSKNWKKFLDFFLKNFQLPRSRCLWFLKTFHQTLL